MKSTLFFLSLLSALCIPPFVVANTEKLVFVSSPLSLPFPVDQYPLHLPLDQLPIITPTQSLRTSLAVAPRENTTGENPADEDGNDDNRRPPGESWHLLQDVEPGRRYEVRVCWAAIQPTDLNLTLAPLPASPTTHLLRIHALSAAVLSNSTRTSPPTTVDVDIILDPYTLHYLPRSLEPAAAYTLLVAAFALPLAHLVAHFLLTPATRKLHRE